MRKPFFLTTVGNANSILSYVVYRLSHCKQRRLRLMARPSSDDLESKT
ncbi:hypothetical protein TASI_1366 [Taylorella asinigenitalis MCE3]|uniref:Uncharacterized protein n=1 Tax=Taylorella asinigenitalis (strain MCE3) TaxID=1008459 RepID=G4QA33_TAYAM|nr:hypothetical protein TASI_1366 [Taylorella asinigenitalis MCE3]